MHTTIHAYAEKYRGVAAGLLAVLGGSLVLELWATPLFLLLALMLSGIALILARNTSHHFHGGHHHAGDSAFDGVAVVILFIVNIFHPAIDGFSLYEAIHFQGTIAGLIIGGSIVLHEIIRQSALISIFSCLRIKGGWIISTALFGIVLGVIAGVVGATAIERYEPFIDVVTVFAYSFIIAESYYDSTHHKKSTSIISVLMGVVLGGILVVFL